MRTCLRDVGHPQPARPLKTKHSISHGIINVTVKQKISKYIDMRCYWLKD